YADLPTCHRPLFPTRRSSDLTVSSAFGMAMSGQPTTLLTGDLTLFHDMNGLMLSHQAHVPMTIIVVNNQGGGIFSFLPQSEAARSKEHTSELQSRFDIVCRLL